MTREEAIKVIEILEKRYITFDNEEQQALIMAIETLKQEPCDDTVSRQAVKSALCELCGDKNNCPFVNRDCDVLNAINTLPFVIPKEKTGHWVKYSVPRCGEQHYQCSSCGYYINFGQWGEVYTKQFKYCPNCGIKMVEQQESEDKDDISIHGT